MTLICLCALLSASIHLSGPLDTGGRVIATTASVLIISLGLTTLSDRAERALFACINCLRSRLNIFTEKNTPGG